MHGSPSRARATWSAIRRPGIHGCRHTGQVEPGHGHFFPVMRGGKQLIYDLFICLWGVICAGIFPAVQGQAEARSGRSIAAVSSRFFIRFRIWFQCPAVSIVQQDKMIDFIHGASLYLILRVLVTVTGKQEGPVFFIFGTLPDPFFQSA